MPFSQWKNIKEGKEFLILRNFVAGYFALYYFRENGHNEFEKIDDVLI
jgi:hypothetical protein